MKGAAIPIGVLPILAPNYTNKYAWLSSVDWTLSERDQLRGRYVDNRTSAISTAANLPVFYFPRPTTAKLLSLGEFHNFNPRVINELRLAYNRYNDDIQVPDFQFPGLDMFPNIQIVSDLNLQMGPNPSAPSATIQSTYQLADNLSWVHGRHEFRFGFDGRRLLAATTFIRGSAATISTMSWSATCWIWSPTALRSATSAANRIPAITTRFTATLTTTGRQGAISR